MRATWNRNSPGLPNCWISVSSSILARKQNIRIFSKPFRPTLASPSPPTPASSVIINLSFAERAAIVLSLVPLIRPQLLDIFHTKNKTFDRRFTEFGGVPDAANGEFVPTGETLAFILAANNLELRFALQALFEREHFFAKHSILRLVPQGRDEPILKGSLRLSEEYFGLFTTGHARRPDLSAEFPARHIETQLNWADLVLHPGTLRQVREIEVWIRHGETLMIEWDMAAKLRPGYRALFYGPPGTGKTMTACLLGKSTGREVYNIDLSLVISKYIGETEKNLAHVFDQTQHKGWILFFDEADALFGKRSETKMLTTATPIRKSLFSCNALRPSTGLQYLPPTSARTWTKHSLGDSSLSFSSRCRGPRNDCASGCRVSRPKPDSRNPLT